MFSWSALNPVAVLKLPSVLRISAATPVAVFVVSRGVAGECTNSSGRVLAHRWCCQLVLRRRWPCLSCLSCCQLARYRRWPCWSCQWCWQAAPEHRWPYFDEPVVLLDSALSPMAVLASPVLLFKSAVHSNGGVGFAGSVE